MLGAAILMTAACTAVLGVDKDYHAAGTCDGAGHCVGCLTAADCADDPDGHTICGPQGTCVGPSCGDLILNGGESDVDCGGAACNKCDDDLKCLMDGDCQSNHCGADGTCLHATCEDGILNNNQLGETDVDCGGTKCDPCAFDKQCLHASDCIGGLCLSTQHCAATCSDTVQNGDESDVDCGGSCPDCVNGSHCAVAGDCESNFCDVSGPAGVCASCTVNGNCSGTQFCKAGVCSSNLADGETCGGDPECMSGHCVDSVCCDEACDAACKACNVMGSVGTCADIPKMQQDYSPQDACSGASHCDGQGGCLKPLGGSCSADSGCQSGHCADGVCCDTACTSTCKSCSLSGLAGKCTNNPPYLPDPDTGCVGAVVCDGYGYCLLGPGQPCSWAAQCASHNCDPAYFCH